MTGGPPWVAGAASYTRAVIEAAELGRFELFDGIDPAVLGHLSSRLEAGTLAASEVLLHQGEMVDRFVIILDGSVDVVRGVGDFRRRLAVCGPGSILGELSLMRHRPRVASVCALSAVRYASGDHGAFEELLAVPGVHQRLVDTAARRMAEIARPLRVTLADGSMAFVRPLLRSDRTRFAEEVRGLLPESRRRRFFTSGPPSDRLIDYLVNIDYIDHFAWTVGGSNGRGLGTARYIRVEDPTQAEVAFGVVDEMHGKGLGTMLLGALGAAASEAGITTFVADVLDDNLPMRRVFDKADADWHRTEAGVVSARMEVEATRGLISADYWAMFAEASTEIVTAAGAALGHPGQAAGS